MPPAGILVWVPLGAIASAAWFVTTARLLRIWGHGEAAQAIALVAAVAVAFTLWRWAQDDRERAAIDAGRCPRCDAALAWRHQHAGAGTATGLQQWDCAVCGYQHAERLTCAECAA